MKLLLPLAALIVAVPAAAQERDSAGRIISQPARDVGASRTEVPAVLQRAEEAPYTTRGVTRCAGIAREIAALSEELGDDYGADGDDEKDSRSGRVARAGGRAVVNSIIPFRSLVREISGAAPAERRLRDAIGAGLARRGFLRGLQSAKGCKR